jgi:hypothetical protein
MSASGMRVGLIFIAGAMALVAVCSLFLLNLDSSLTDKCAAFTAIAKDTPKMRYVREWVAKRTADKEFMAVVREHQWFEHGSPLTSRYIDIDWRYLGFDPDAAWVAFNVDERDADPVTILTISLNQGRAGIILKLKPTDDVVGDGPPGNPSTVEPVGDDTFVYCDFGD